MEFDPRTKTDEEVAILLARRVAEAGGRAYFVGGCVRDVLLGKKSKDLDVEVHGLAPAALEGVLAEFGQVRLVGKSFGVYGLEHRDIDIALPRKEKCIGRGHRDLDVSVDPFLGTEKAAKRRDFTINAMMRDVLTGEIIDHFGGRADLAAGIVRHVDERTFAEDPLRVLRAAQFAARFGFRIDPETVRLASGADLTALPSERVEEELKKALLKAERPSVFFECVRSMGQGDFWFGPVFALAGVPQDPSFHPEGDAWTHTMLVLDAAARLRDGAEDPYAFLLAALLHDVGKASCTFEKNGRIHAYGHEQAGAEIFSGIRFPSEKRARTYVENMILLHMKPNRMAAQRARERSFMLLFEESVSPDDLLLLARADHEGSLGTGPYADTERFLRAMRLLFRERSAAPAVTGEDLLRAGMEPGPAMGAALRLGRRLQLAGEPKEAALRQVLGQFGKGPRKEGKIRTPGEGR